MSHDDELAIIKIEPTSIELGNMPTGKWYVCGKGLVKTENFEAHFPPQFGPYAMAKCCSFTLKGHPTAGKGSKSDGKEKGGKGSKNDGKEKGGKGSKSSKGKEKGGNDSVDKGKEKSGKGSVDEEKGGNRKSDSEGPPAKLPKRYS
jgi:hypothetical protein